MVSPNLIKRNQDFKTAEINENAKRLFQVIYNNQNKKVTPIEDDTPRISVSVVISKLAFFMKKLEMPLNMMRNIYLEKMQLFVF